MSREEHLPENTAVSDGARYRPAPPFMTHPGYQAARLFMSGNGDLRGNVPRP
ncbi:TPA: hypothetical protein J1W04_004622 [Escherichia coli]|uniref:hypothetical protein n=1 Tax=Escherichia coli TaxID=562 RepID=UPI001485760A|nr:hypothetical protein [Escherichia coli]EFU9512348.1 hypothetical protein [Escherichia coli]EFU9515881.1 hypothetical protein [Escherichia coli]EHK0876090.1 hypothetical protein [Escherichia coli]EHM2971084.1 hypothetical protein [Escherichia coli]EHM3218058.1 hypothetical protein [Escherichia coli]